MASLKRPKTKRQDQPDMFAPPVEGETTGDVTAERNDQAVRFTRNKNNCSSNADTTNTTPPATDSPPAPPPPPPPRVYTKRTPTAPIILDGVNTDTAGATGTQRHIYIARHLLFAEVVAPAWEVMPDEMQISFIGEEGPPFVSRPCSLLTIELEQTILDKLAELEVAFERNEGTMSELDYHTARRRWRALQEAWARLPVHVTTGEA